MGPVAFFWHVPFLLPFRDSFNSCELPPMGKRSYCKVHSFVKTLFFFRRDHSCYLRDCFIATNASLLTSLQTRYIFKFTFNFFCLHCCGTPSGRYFKLVPQVHNAYVLRELEVNYVHFDQIQSRTFFRNRAHRQAKKYWDCSCFLINRGWIITFSDQVSLSSQFQLKARSLTPLHIHKIYYKCLILSKSHYQLHRSSWSTVYWSPDLGPANPPCKVHFQSPQP